MTLRIAPDLQLPPTVVTQTFGILAKRGVGQDVARVLIEKMLRAQAPRGGAPVYKRITVPGEGDSAGRSSRRSPTR